MTKNGLISSVSKTFNKAVYCACSPVVGYALVKSASHFGASLFVNAANVVLSDNGRHMPEELPELTFSRPVNFVLGVAGNAYDKAYGNGD